jgi:hypothetical protein
MRQAGGKSGIRQLAKQQSQSYNTPRILAVQPRGSSKERKMLTINPKKAIVLKRGQRKLPEGIVIKANASREEARRQMTDVVAVKSEWSDKPLGPDMWADMLRQSGFTP